MADDTAVALGAVSAGKATVTVLDAKGIKFDIVITAGASNPFFTTLGATLKITPGAFGTQTFLLGGGVPPYLAVSDVPSAVSVAVNGSVLTVTALQAAGSAIAPTKADILLIDSASPPTSLKSVVTVGATVLAVTPDAIASSVRVGDVLRAIITGGAPPYRALVSVDDSVIAVKIVNGNQLQAVVGQVFSETVVVAIVDSNNVAVEFSISKSEISSNALRVSPETMQIPESTSTPNLLLSVFGVTSFSDTVQVFSSDPTFLKPGTPVKNAAGTGYDIPLTGGNTCSATIVAAVAGVTDPVTGLYTTLPVKAAGGDRTITITVLDGKGSKGTSTITIKDNNGIAGC
jgi:hypothetical protein